MHLQLADVSKNSTLVINHKDYEIIFCVSSTSHELLLTSAQPCPDSLQPHGL